MDILQLIKERRSIREYKDKEVPDELLNKILEAARWAPSWANTQCWQFIVIKDKTKKQQLSETLIKGNPAKEAVINAPILICACAKKSLSGFYKGSPVTDKGDSWYMFDVALAMQNLSLVAHSLGLGTVHIGAFDANKVKEILNIPAEIEVVELMPIGYPKEDIEIKIPKRKELNEIVFYEEYGKTLNSKL